MVHPSPVHSSPDQEVLDLVGVGFGPSNLALAIAIADHNAGADPDERLSARFVERQERFGWHRGMLIEDATMRVSFLKDLVTLRNPTSSISFLSYLHDHDRLIDFINYGSFFPTRIEFHDYLEWAAARFRGQVEYGAEVVEIVAVESAGGSIDHVEVISRRADGGDDPAARPQRGAGDRADAEPAMRGEAQRPGLAQPGSPDPLGRDRRQQA